MDFDLCCWGGAGKYLGFSYCRECKATSLFMSQSKIDEALEKILEFIP